MTIAPLPAADTSTNVDALFAALHSAIPTMADDELIETFAHADDLYNRAWLVQSHCLWEARRRQHNRNDTGDVTALCRGFELPARRANELIAVWETFVGSGGQPPELALPKTFYVEALEADDPQKWVERAQDERAANPFYSVRDMRDGIAAEKQEQATRARRVAAPVEQATVERYGVIVADPPWLYEQATTTLQGTTGHHYHDLSIDDLCGLPVSSVAAKDSILLLWCTWPQLLEGLRLVEAWGYKYVTGFPWIKIQGTPQVNLAGAVNLKPQYGVGFWTRGCSEFVLIARRGNVSPPKNGWVGILSPNFQHSRKPENLYDFAESIPGPYLELFARRPRDGWTSLGDGIDGKDIRDALAEVIG